MSGNGGAAGGGGSGSFGTGSRFTPQNQTTQQRLSTNVVGLVNLSDFRKRRAEVLEQQEREAREAATNQGNGSGSKASSAPQSSGGAAGSLESAAATTKPKTDDVDSAGRPKKKKKDSKKSKSSGVKLSFLGDDEEGEDEAGVEVPAKTNKKTKDTADGGAHDSGSDTAASTTPSSALPVPRSFTKQALRRQAVERDALRKEFLARQAAVKAAEVAIPFVFYEGANIPGGVAKVKKGDFVWVFLDKSRKVAAKLGVGEKKLSKARQHWARVGVDDLMLVRGTLIIPHHYDFYFFVINKTIGPGGQRVFDYSGEAPPKPETETGQAGGDPSAAKPDKPANPLLVPGASSSAAQEEDLSHLEGYLDDPGLTKVVDRRWYERNKHIYPANVWQEFDPEQDYTQQVRRDQGGNAFFFAPQ